jgi:hypothetical protein
MADTGGIKATIPGCYKIGHAAFISVSQSCCTSSYASATSRQSLRSSTLRILNMELARLYILPVSDPRGYYFSN